MASTPSCGSTTVQGAGSSSPCPERPTRSAAGRGAAGLRSVRVEAHRRDHVADVGVPRRGRGRFVLPVKKAVRRAEDVEVGDLVAVRLACSTSDRSAVMDEAAQRAPSNFMGADGRLHTIPTKHAKLLVLDRLAQEFEPGAPTPSRRSTRPSSASTPTTPRCAATWWRTSSSPARTAATGAAAARSRSRGSR